MRKIKIMCSCLLILCLSIVSLKFLTDLTERKDSDFKYRPFFEQKENFDVLFLGTSHVINGIFPMELWNDYGLVSYNFGGHANALPTSYWVMENALDYTNPRLVVIDCLGLSSETKTSGDFSYAHLSMDTFPFSLTKLSSVRDLLNDSAIQEGIANGTVQDGESRTKMSLLWDYAIYHSRWNELSVSDFTPGSSREKGAESRIAVSVPNEIPSVPFNQKLEEDTTGTSYLCKMIEDCKHRGIEVMLVYLPFPAGEGDQMAANRVSDIAKEYDVNYINFLNMDIATYETDCFDSYSHLNPSGARKVTDYLGQYITKHYKIPDQRKNPDYKNWYNDYADYQQFKIENLQSQQTLDTYLMLLADKNYDAVIEVSNPAIWKNEKYAALLKNLGIDQNQMQKDTDAFFVQGDGKHTEYFNRFTSSEKSYQTAAGTLKINIEGDTRNMYLDEKKLYQMDILQAEKAGIRITVLNHKTKEKVDQVVFALQGKDDIAQDYLSVTEVVRPEAAP